MNLKNITTPVLLTVNAVFLLVIIILLFVLMRDEYLAQNDDHEVTVEAVDRVSIETDTSTVSDLNERVDKVRQSLPGDDVRSISSSVSVEVDAGSVDTRAELAIRKFKNKIDQDARFYEKLNELASVEEGIESALRSDTEYMEQYISMKQQRPATFDGNVSVESAKSAVREDAGTDADRFNKIVVDKNNTEAAQGTLADLLRKVVESAESQSGAVRDKAGVDQVQAAYIASLQDAAVERRNEMRTIKVRPGDTLWKISTRAYGIGFDYKRIFDANPHLTSPHQITAGEVLRVPL